MINPKYVDLLDDAQRNRSFSDEDRELFGGERISSAQRGCADISILSATVLSRCDEPACSGMFNDNDKKEQYINSSFEHYPSDCVPGSSCDFNFAEEPVYRSLAMPEVEIAVGPRSTYLTEEKFLNHNASTQPKKNAFVDTPVIDASRIVVSRLPSYYRLEPKFHKNVQAESPSVIVVVIDKVLREKKVDFEFKENKCKWKCCFANNSSVVYFNIQIWGKSTCTPINEFAVEFQRRTGDASPFISIYGEAVAAFERAQLVQKEHLKRTSERSMLYGPMSLKAPQMPSDDEIADSVRPLVEMVESCLDDAVLEGAKALAQLSSCKDHRLVLHKCGVVKALVDLLDRQDIGTGSTHAISSQMFASACLANLSEEPIAQESLYHACGLLLKKVDNGQYSDRPMRREAARILRNLAQDDQGMNALIDQIGKPRLEVWCEETYPKLEDEDILTDAMVVQQRLHGRLQACN